MDSSRLKRKSQYGKSFITFFNKTVGKTIFYSAILRFYFDKTFKVLFKKTENEIFKTIQKESANFSQIESAILVIEDKRFFDHLGVDLYGIARAAYRCLFYKKLEGASTIEQQLVRLITNDREITISRKIKEILIAVLISNIFDKDQILKAYCIKYRFGQYSGVQSLCKQLSINISDIKPIESAILAARLKYPTLSDKNYPKYLKRVRTIEILISNK